MENESFGNHIVQYPGKYSLCLGCESCEILCGFARDGLSGLNRGGIHVDRGDLRSLMHTVLVCQQCESHPCYEACPKQDEAMFVDENGVVYIDEDGCIGCGRCRKACVFKPSRIAIVKTRSGRKARKCDLCRTRPEGPLCIEQCPAVCLGQSKDPAPYEEEKAQ